MDSTRLTGIIFPSAVATPLDWTELFIPCMSGVAWSVITVAPDAVDVLLQQAAPPDFVVVQAGGVAEVARLEPVRAAAPMACVIVVGSVGVEGEHIEAEVEQAAWAAGADEYLPQAEVTAYWLQHAIRRAVRLVGVIRDSTARREAEEALRISEENLRAAMQIAPVVLARVDRDLRYTWVHHPPQGFAVEEVLGRKMGEIAPAGQIHRVVDAVHHVLASGQRTQVEYFLELKDGRNHFESVVEPVRNAAGEVEGALVSSVDVTPHRRLIAALAANEERYRLLVNAISVATWETNAVGETVTLLPSWEAYTGQQWPDYTGFGWLAAYHPDDRAGLLAEWQVVLVTEGEYHVQARLWHAASAGYHYVEIHGVPIRNAEGVVDMWFGVTIDVHEQKLSEIALAARVEEMETLMDILPVGVFIATDPEVKQIVGNQRAHEILRQGQGANLAVDAPSAQHTLAFDAWINGRLAAPEELPIQYAARHGVEVRDVEVEYHFQGGSVICYYGAARPLFHATGTVRGAVGVFVDITERKRLERELENSRAQFLTFMNNLPMRAFIKDSAGRFRFVNHYMEESFNLPLSRWLAKTDREVFPNLEDASQWMAHDQEVLTSGQVTRFTETIVEDGEVRNFLSIKFPMQNSEGDSFVGGIAVDVTDQVRTEQALRASEERFQLAAKAATGMIYDWDAETGKIYRSDGLERLLGISPAEVAPEFEWWANRIHPEDRERFLRVRAEAYAGTVEKIEIEYRVRHADGHWVHVRDSSYLVRDDCDRVRRVVGSSADITAHKELEQELERRVAARTTELAQANALLRQVLDTLPVGVWIYDEKGELLHGNPEGERIWGHKGYTGIRDAHLYRAWRPETGEPLLPEQWSGVRAVQYGETTLDEILEIESLDGVRRIMLTSAIPLLAPDKTLIGAIVVNQDISQRHQLEVELHEVQRRLEEGREAERVYLARELHDLPMQELHTAGFALYSLKQLMAQLRDLEEGEHLATIHALAGQVKELADLVDERLQTANRMLRELCNELRPPILESFGLSAAIEAHAQVFQIRQPALEVRLELVQSHLGLPDWVGLALFRIYQQALDNIVQHAQASHIFVGLTLAGTLLVLEVRDNGRGFVVPARWVELARANHLGIIGAVERASHIGGRYEVISAPGKGTTVRVTLPLSQEWE